MKKPEKKCFLAAFQRIYIYGSKELKGKILTQICQEYGLNRKYVTRRLNQMDRPKKRKPGPKVEYDSNILLEPLKEIWMATDFMCGQRLKEAMPLWLPFYEKSFGSLAKGIKLKLIQMSSATINRLLKPARIKSKRRGWCGTKPGKLLKNQIEIKTDHWDVTQPGFTEADTVAHCGNSTAGDFVWSLTLTDICTCWTENRAVWNKGAEGVRKQVEDIEVNLPFILRGFDCDSGSEFLNWHLIRYLKERENQVQVTRSRPYKKNDNAHVEQKNWTHVRHLFGYDRFDNPKLVDMMNDLYKNEWSLMINFFYPTMKLKEKRKINSKYQRKYDKPKTPYQRLMESDHIDKGVKKELKKKFESVNPFELKEQIEKKLKKIFDLVHISTKVRRRI